MILVNGQLQGSISVLDRGLSYGDGLFETIAVVDLKPQLLALHWKRLQTGCKRLKINCPEIPTLLDDVNRLLVNASRTQQTQCVIKLIVTRGAGRRGYAYTEGVSVTRLAILSDWPSYRGSEPTEGVQLIVCRTYLSSQPILAGIKHLNRLEQVMARSEWSDKNSAEGLMLDDNNNMIEGTMSNIFFVDGMKVIHTPALDCCGVAGVQRANILAQAKTTGFKINIDKIPLGSIADFEEVFISNSLIGIWPVTMLGDRAYEIGPVTKTLQKLIQDAIK